MGDLRKRPIRKRIGDTVRIARVTNWRRSCGGGKAGSNAFGKRSER
jgi:hypothetical protein